MVRTCLAASLSVFLLASTASAADADATAPDPGATLARRVPDPPLTRGAALPALYGALVGLQAYDGWTTVSGARRGAAESNPVLRGVASNPTAMFAIKAGATTASIYAAERLWRRHRRVEAIATMVAVNGLMAAVAARNTSVVRGFK